MRKNVSRESFDLDPEAGWHHTIESRQTRMKPKVARLVLMAAGGRIMREAEDSGIIGPEVLQYAGRYLGMLFDRIDSHEKRTGGRPLSLGRPIRAEEAKLYAESQAEQYTARAVTSPDADLHTVASNALMPARAEDAVILAKLHIGDAYVQYTQFEQAQAADPAQTTVNWH